MTMNGSRQDAASMLCPTADQFPLGRAFDQVDVSPEAASGPGSRPFGLRFAVEPCPTLVDFTGFEYDPGRQVGVLRDGAAVVPLIRHTTGTTRTQTSDGHERMDSDSDQRADD